MTSSLIFRASSFLNSALHPPPLVYHNLSQTMLSCTQCPHTLFTVKSCNLHSCVHFSIYSEPEPWNCCRRHRYNKTTAVTMPVLVSCVAQLLPPTLNTHHHQPLQQHCKHSQQTLSVVISAELLLADRELTTLSH